MSRTRTLPAFIALLLLLTGAVAQQGGAQAQPSDGTATNLLADYDLSWWTVDVGGQTFSTEGNFRLGGTIGQADAGALSAGDYTLAGGFWPSVTRAAVAYSTYLPIVLQYWGTLGWTSRAAMPTPRHSAATASFGGKVYVIGGSSSTGPVAAVEVYNPASDSWSTRTPMPTAKCLASAVALGTRIYVLGSDTLVYAYDPAADSWASVAPIPQPVNGEHGLGVVNGKLYVAMGSLWLYAYDPTVDTWATKTPVPVERSISSFAALNGRLYAIGGGEPGHEPSEITRVDVYDPATDSWEIGPIPDMPTRRTHMDRTTPVINGKIYVIGGWDGYSELSAVDIYDSATDSWSVEMPMPTARYAMGSCAVGTAIYVIGGDLGGAGGNWLSTNEEIVICGGTPLGGPR